MCYSFFSNPYIKAIGKDIPKLIKDFDFSESRGEFEYLTKSSAVYSSNIEGNSIDLSSSNNSDLFFTSEYSYNNLIKHIGNKTFNIKNINAEEFSVSLTINLYSLIDNTKTPLIKGIFGYVTE